MAFYVNGAKLGTVYRNGSKLDNVYYNNNRVWQGIIPVAKPTVSANLTYNGSSQSPTISPSSSAGWYIKSDSVTSATNGGTYYVTFVLNTGYAWTDGTTADYTVSWTIKRQSVAIPTITTPSVAYIGTAVSPTVSGYNANLMVASGNTSYSGISNSLVIYWTLRNSTNYQWSDGTITRKSGNWSTYAGTITWYLNRRQISTTFTMQTTYGVSFNGCSGIRSNTVASRFIEMGSGTNAVYILYENGTQLLIDSVRNSGGTAYAGTAVPSHGATYY